MIEKNEGNGNDGNNGNSGNNGHGNNGHGKQHATPPPTPVDIPELDPRCVDEDQESELLFPARNPAPRPTPAMVNPCPACAGYFKTVAGLEVRAILTPAVAVGPKDRPRAAVLCADIDESIRCLLRELVQSPYDGEPDASSLVPFAYREHASWTIDEAELALDAIKLQIGSALRQCAIHRKLGDRVLVSIDLSGIEDTFPPKGAPK
jgi:hypothetical protein